MGLSTLLTDLTIDYISVYHKVILNIVRIPVIIRLLLLFRKIHGSLLKYLKNLHKYFRVYSILKEMYSMPQ